MELCWKDPAALPHVLGVSSLNRDGNGAELSNRDFPYVDMSPAPGEEIFSMLPRALTLSSQARLSASGLFALRPDGVPPR